jgi:predicted RND superfamily exporter protein
MADPMQSWKIRILDRLILAYPRLVLALTALIVCFFTFQARLFSLDASSETLILQSDEDLQYARKVAQRYGSYDFLILTYTPHGDLFVPETLARLARLRDELQALERVGRVRSLLDVPLLESPPVSIKELRTNLRYLTTTDLDMDLAREELRHSPLYQNLMISPDLRTTALLATFQEDQEYAALRDRRNALRDRQHSGPLTAAERAELLQVTETFKQDHERLRRERHEDIVAIRAIAHRYRDQADLFLGGVSMIADDMITFIRSDLKTFGLGVTVFLIITLGAIFRKARWVLLPMLCCLVSTICMIGLLGWFGWEVTVISSNFISLQLIMTMAVAIHLIVRYRELLRDHPTADQRTLVRETVRLKLNPCLFATLTTVAGFASLLLCDILPVITFGWMMIVGLCVSLAVTFILFPCIMLLMPKPAPQAGRITPHRWSGWTARLTEKHGMKVIIFSALAMLLSLLGILRLTVENSFINYFKADTEIARGMRVVDRQLGGTTPLDIILHFDRSEPNAPDSDREPLAESETGAADSMDDFSQFDDFEAEFSQEPDDLEKYWFTPDKMDLVKKIHRYLENLPQSGKVLSLATTLEMARRFNEGKPLDGMAMALLFNEAPDDLQEILIKPYVSVENNEARFSMRIRDSLPGLRRNQLLQTIQQDLQNLHGLSPDRFRLAGMMVLYNNMLQSLFDSQILTLGMTLIALMAMFLILFRSVKIALIAIFPNALSIAMVLGFMGWAGIPLDLMTITIAAISVGIAVDDTIHYIHRFRDEFPRDHNYKATMHRCHNSIGHAMTYTSLTIILGFSILALSNFIPSICFGLLTSLAMLMALLAALTLLPQLIIMTRPFGQEGA